MRLGKINSYTLRPPPPFHPESHIHTHFSYGTTGTDILLVTSVFSLRLPSGFPCIIRYGIVPCPESSLVQFTINHNLYGDSDACNRQRHKHGLEKLTASTPSAITHRRRAIWRIKTRRPFFIKPNKIKLRTNSCNHAK